MGNKIERRILTLQSAVWQKHSSLISKQKQVNQNKNKRINSNLVSSMINFRIITEILQNIQKETSVCERVTKKTDENEATVVMQMVQANKN